jgi:hypothetical protein
MDKNIEKSDILELLGIKIEDGKIEIDTNKTKSFFSEIENKIKSNLENLQKSIEEGKLDLKDKVGIRVEKDKIEIDLKKGQEFLEELSNKFQNSLKEIESTIKKIVPDN